MRPSEIKPRSGVGTARFDIERESPRVRVKARTTFFLARGDLNTARIRYEIRSHAHRAPDGPLNGEPPSGAAAKHELDRLTRWLARAVCVHQNEQGVFT